MLVLHHAEPPGPRTGPGTQEVPGKYLSKECIGPLAVPLAHGLRLDAQQGVGEGSRSAMRDMPD